MIKKILNNNALWALIAVLINSAINFLIVPYVSQNIGVEAYGFVTLANTLATYVDVISIALNSFAGRYIAIEYHKGNYKKASKYYSSIFISDFILVIGMLMICVFAIPNIQYFINISPSLDRDVKILFVIVFFRYSLVLLRNAFDVSTFIKNRLDLTEKFRAFSYFIQAGILIITCTNMKPHVWYVGFASFMAALFLFLVQGWCANRYTPELMIKRNLFSKDCVKDFLISGIWNSINNIGNLLNSGLDILITNKMLTEVLMGMVSISKTLGSLCYTLVVAISNSFRPKQLECYSKGDIPLLIKRMKESMRITGAICAIIIAGFYACGNEFISLWLPGQDTYKIYILSLIVLLSDVMIGVVNPLYYVFTLTKKLKFPCFITIAMGITNIVSMYFLIKYTSLGAYAVVLTTMILNFIHFIDTPIYSAYCLQVSFKTFYGPIMVHLVNCLVNVGIMKLISSILPFKTTWLFLLLKIIILGLVGVGNSVLITTNLTEKKDILKKMRHII